MDLTTASTFILELLEYVLPAAFLWALTERAVTAIIRAAVGRSKNGL